jgi:hypothetical protein
MPNAEVQSPKIGQESCQENKNSRDVNEGRREEEKQEQLDLNSSRLASRFRAFVVAFLRATVSPNGHGARHTYCSRQA